MKEGRKLYSLILKAENGNYYRIKIGDDYRNPLAFIDTYTVQYPDKKILLESFSYKLKTKIIDAKIIYKKQGKTKTIEPVFADMEELGLVSKDFGKSSEIDMSDYKKSFRVHLFAKKLMDVYFQDINIRNAFNNYGDHIVRETLMNHDERALVHRLCEYRKLRKSAILKRAIELGQNIDVYPSIVSINEDKIIKSETRLLELLEEEINKVQNEQFTDQTLKPIQAQRLKELYTQREELIEALDSKADKNQVTGQMRLF